MNNKFEPIININKKTSSLKDKHVAIKGNDDFSRDTSNKLGSLPSKTISNIDPTIMASTTLAIDKRYKATMTQKISPSVNLKINTLKPFLGDLENMDKTTVNDILNLLLDNYVNTKFSTRQQEAFNSMYNTQLELLKK